VIIFYFITWCGKNNTQVYKAIYDIEQNLDSLEENKEISALFNLIDDPDEEVYMTISDKIISFGKEIIPNLENLWEVTSNENIQERIELLIHTLHFKELGDDFTNWKDTEGDILSGAILCARYHYPEMNISSVKQEIEKIRKNIWLELNNYLTPLEQINVITSILYNYFKLKGTETAYHHPEHFLINRTLETKTGNSISNGIIYLIIAELLDLPIHAVNIPRQFLLAYFEPNYDFTGLAENANPDKILFFIDSLNGQVYSHTDVENYFKRIGVTPSSSYYKKMDNTKTIQVLLKELSKCFDNDLNKYKMHELEFIIDLIDSKKQGNS
jgi:hypothetical protein